MSQSNDQLKPEKPPRKEWRDAEGSIIKKTVETKDYRGKTKKHDIYFARVRFTDDNGKRREKKRQAKSAADAVIVRRQLHSEIEAERQSRIEAEERANEPKTFNQVLDYFETEFVKEAVISNDQKIEGYKEDLGIINNHIARFRVEFGEKLVAKINYDDIKRYKIKRLGEPVKVEYYEKIKLTDIERKELPKNSRRRFRFEKRVKESPRKFASVHRELARLRRILNIAVRQGWIDANPFSKGEPLIQPGLETSRLRICSFEEEKVLINECTGKREHLAAIIVFALDTAMRKAEIFNLKWQDIDLEKRRIFVRATNTKTGKSRYVPLTSRVEKLIEPLRHFEADDDLVFGIKTDADSAWNSAIDAAEIEGLTFHDLRATGITRMLRAGLSEAETMKISGHTQYSTFLKYVRSDAEGSKSASDKMDAYLSNLT